MDIAKSKRFLVTCVAVIIVVVVAFVVINKMTDNDKPADSSTNEPVSVYPERGFAEAIVKDSGRLRCDRKTVASTLLADDGGTVSANGVLVSSKWSKNSVLISFGGGQAPFVSGYVMGSQGSEPFNVPSGSRALLLSTIDFSKSGAFKDITLCGGGM